MKKKNLKSLILNKKSISKLDIPKTIVGGITAEKSCFICDTDLCDSLICDTVFCYPHK